MSQHKQENVSESYFEKGISESFDPDMALSDAMEEYKLMANVDGRSENTLNIYDYVFGKFANFLSEDTEIGSISTKMVRQYLAWLANNDFKKTTIAINHRVLNALFTWLVEESFLKESPTEQIDKPKTPDKYPKVLNKNQLEKVLKAAKERKGSWSGFRNYVIVLVFIDTGIRRLELIGAKMDDLDLKSHSLKVHGKGAKDRKVYFGPKTLKALQRWRRAREKVDLIWDDTIFISRDGEKMKPRNLNRRISVIQEHAGLEDIQVSPHVFRHTSATLAVENGLDAFSLKRQFGWEKIETAMRYVHMSDASIEKAYRESSPLSKIKD